MKQWLLRLALGGIALYLTSLVLNGLGAALSPVVPHELSHIDLSSMKMGPDWGRAAVAVLALSLVNSLIRPVVGFFGKPLSILSLGISSLVINSVLFWGVGYLTGGYEIKGVVAFILGPILMGLLGAFLNITIRDK